MKNEDDAGAPPNATAQLRSQQVDNAIRAIQQKKSPPEIDFTIHVMQDGTQVNTQERVCKGMEAIRRRVLRSYQVSILHPT